jgi:lipopolysaccharide/colanic/teichoic acid biosynthesis glycosyltransferase
MHLDPAMLQRVRSTRAYDAPQLKYLGSPVPLYGEVPAWKRSTKRAFDVAASLAALTGFGLLLPFLALAIKLDSRGPIFYGQTRVGINRRRGDRRNRAEGPPQGDERRDRGAGHEARRLVAEGKPFTIWKLRTMYVNSESEGMRWASENDPRITRMGRFLRLTRLDEFPQFYNVLRGEMSVVGPRPERPPFITLLSQEVPGYLERLRFKPGITGLAQVENGYDDSLESVHNKVAKDLEYITRFSLSRDLGILARTVRVVVTGEGAL